MKKEKKNGQKAKYGLFTASLVMAAGVFAVMTYMQKMALSDFEKRDIYVASTDIPRGTVIDIDAVQTVGGCIVDLVVTVDTPGGAELEV